MIKKHFILVFIFWSFMPFGYSQEKLSLTIVTDVFVESDYRKQHTDSLSVFNEISNFQTFLQAKGYLSSYRDTIFQKENKYECRFIVGDRYSWEKLKISPIISQITQKPYLTNSVIISNRSITTTIENILVNCQNIGYPFAQVYFDSIEIKQGKVTANLELTLRDLILVDSIIVKGGLKTSQSYVENLIGIKKGDVYNESKIAKINANIQNISFVQLIRTSEIYFSKGKATLVLFLKDKSASRFDGIIGLNPDEITGKVGIVGDLKVDLLNSFKKGERIILNWEQAKFNSQKYLVSFDYPFLFKTKIGLQSSLNYYRQDTTFANLNVKGGFSYFLDEKQNVGISIQRIESNSLLQTEISSMDFPEFNSVSTTYYGVNYSMNSLDYRLNPRKGWLIQADLNTGRKKTVLNPNLLDEDYTKIEEISTQIKTNFSLSYFIPLFKKNTLLLKASSGNLFGDNIFVNELFQLGGLHSIRGFNQQSIFASNYYLGTAEFRYLFDVNSSVFSFFDYGFYENKSLNAYQKDTPFGFGFGTNFQTKAGIFSISYGLGKEKGNPILFKNGKVHFGFVSLF